MQCPLCGFENIPGTQRCTSCRSQLEAAAPPAPADLTPPRAGALKGIRSVVYAINRFLDRLPARPAAWLGRVFNTERGMPGEALAAMLLSVLPGVGHLATGRRLAALAAAGVWLLLGFITANFYSGSTGGLLIGTLASWHACVVFDAGRLQQHTTDVRQRLGAMLFIMILAAIAYFAADRVARGYFDLVVSPFAHEGLGIQQDDTLLAWRRHLTPEDLAPGDLVTIAHGRISGAGYVVEFPDGIAIGVVVARAGDKVTFSAAGVAVNGAPLPDGLLPAGRLLPPPRPSFTVPEESVVISLYFRHHSIFGGSAGQVWRSVFVERVSAVRGRVAMVYMPWGRRHSLR